MTMMTGLQFCDSEFDDRCDNYSSMGSDSSEPEEKEASLNKKKFVPLDSMLEKLAVAGGNERHED